MNTPTPHNHNVCNDTFLTDINVGRFRQHTSSLWPEIKTKLETK